MCTGHTLIFFDEVPLQIFRPFQMGYNCVFRVLYILKIHILYNICDLHAFSPMYVACLSFSSGSVEEKFKYINV